MALMMPFSINMEPNTTSSAVTMRTLFKMISLDMAGHLVGTDIELFVAYG